MPTGCSISWSNHDSNCIKVKKKFVRFTENHPDSESDECQDAQLEDEVYVHSDSNRRYEWESRCHKHYATSKNVPISQ